jgi:hypothetical protein
MALPLLHLLPLLPLPLASPAIIFSLDKDAKREMNVLSLMSALHLHPHLLVLVQVSISVSVPVPVPVPLLLDLFLLALSKLEFVIFIILNEVV